MITMLNTAEAFILSGPDSSNTTEPSACCNNVTVLSCSTTRHISSTGQDREFGWSTCPDSFTPLVKYETLRDRQTNLRLTSLNQAVEWRIKKYIKMNAQNFQHSRPHCSNFISRFTRQWMYILTEARKVNSRGDEQSKFDWEVKQNYFLKEIIKVDSTLLSSSLCVALLSWAAARSRRPPPTEQLQFSMKRWDEQWTC